MNNLEFPVKVLFKEDGTEWILDNMDELGNNLEWFDSNDPKENTDVIDAKGRAISIKVEKLEILRFELVDQEPN